METIDLVVASPLRRTLATASLAFGEGKQEDAVGASDGNGGQPQRPPPQQQQQQQRGQQRRGGYLRPHVPPVVAVEAIRETAGPCVLIDWVSQQGCRVSMSCHSNQFQ